MPVTCLHRFAVTIPRVAFRRLAALFHYPSMLFLDLALPRSTILLHHDAVQRYAIPLHCYGTLN